MQHVRSYLKYFSNEIINIITTSSFEWVSICRSLQWETICSSCCFCRTITAFWENLRFATIFKNWIKVVGQIILVTTLKLLSICCTSVAKAAVRMNGFLLTRSANAHPLTWWWLWWCGNDLGSGVSTLRGGLNPDYSILKQQIIKKCDICATDDDTIIIYYIFKKM